MNVALWAEIRRLAEIDKLSGWAIARRLHCSRHTVAAALKLQQPPAQTAAPRASLLDPYLGQLDLLAHPSRSIQVALAKPTRSETLSGRRLTVVQEPETALEVGARKQDGVFISDLERSLLDAAARPELVGGIAVLAEALGAASSKGVDADRLTSYARALSWGPALRRIGSLADTLHIAGLAGRLEPLTKPSSDIDLEPGHEASSYRDAKWWVRWDHSPSELQNVLHQ